MIGGAQQIADKVEGLLNEWVPAESYGHEREFQSELQEYLDTHLNDSRGILDSDEEYVVSTEHGRSRGDVVVNDVVGIELKRDLSNSQTKKLAGQIKSYRDEYEYVFVVACGIDDMDGWRRLKNDYEQQGLDPMAMDQAPVTFIHKPESEYGAGGSQGSTSSRGGSHAPSGGSLSGAGGSSGEGVDIDAVVADGLTGIKELRSEEDTEMSTGEAMAAVLQLVFVGVVAVVILIVVAQVLL